ncbi:MAG: hypothetical protein ACP5KW_12225, partial [Thermoproteota archaeon]
RATIKKCSHLLNLSYFSLRNWFALWIITNSRFKVALPFIMLIIQLKKFLKKEKGFLPGVLASNENSAINLFNWLVKALVDGLRLGVRLKRNLGSIDIYKAPIIHKSF